MSCRQLSLFEAARLKVYQRIALSLSSFQTCGPSFRHWAIAWSGGKVGQLPLAWSQGGQVAEHSTTPRWTVQVRPKGQWQIPREDSEVSQLLAHPVPVLSQSLHGRQIGEFVALGSDRLELPTEGYSMGFEIAQLVEEAEEFFGHISILCDPRKVERLSPIDVRQFPSVWSSVFASGGVPHVA